MPASRDPEARFWEKVGRLGPVDCWEWQAGCFALGYGAFGWNGRTGYAHRYSYELHHGPIPAGKIVMHRCDNRKCVNPGHLTVGTQLDNLQDRHRKGRDSRGTGHHFAGGIDEDVVKAIYRSNLPPNEAAARFGTTRSVVDKIKTGVTWSWLTGHKRNAA